MESQVEARLNTQSKRIHLIIFVAVLAFWLGANFGPMLVTDGWWMIVWFELNYPLSEWGNSFMSMNTSWLAVIIITMLNGIVYTGFCVLLLWIIKKAVLYFRKSKVPQ